MWRGGPKVELATRRCRVNGLPPKSAPAAIKFRPVQPPQPQMCPVERAEICDFRSMINGLLLFKASGAKVRAALVIVHTVPQSDAKKWRNPVPFVPVSSVCCTCVPGLLPLLLFKEGSWG